MDGVHALIGFPSFPRSKKPQSIENMARPIQVGEVSGIRETYNIQLSRLI